MILYYAPGACSLADHIALIEAGLPYLLIGVDRAKRTEDGRDFLEINPKGYVPALELDDGTVLTENLAILAYIGERGGALLPGEGPARWRALEAVSFMTTEIHGNLKPFFKKLPEPEKERSHALLVRHFAVLARQLGDNDFLLGETMTIADCYLFYALKWAPVHGIEIGAALQAYFERLKERPSVTRALAEEGLT